MSHNNSHGGQQGSGGRGRGGRGGQDGYGARGGYGAGGSYEDYRDSEANQDYEGYDDAGARAWSGRLGPAQQFTQQQAPMMPHQWHGQPAYMAPMQPMQSQMRPAMYPSGYYPRHAPMPHHYPAPQPYVPQRSSAHYAAGPTAEEVEAARLRAELDDIRSEMARQDAMRDTSSRGGFSHDSFPRRDFSHRGPSHHQSSRPESSRGGSSHGGLSRGQQPRQRSRTPKAEASHTSGSTHRQRSPVIGLGIREAVSHLKAPPGTEVDEPCTHCLPRHGLRVARSHYAHECAQLSNPIRSDDRRELRNAFLRRKGERKALGDPKGKGKKGVADSASADAPVTAPTSASNGTTGNDTGGATSLVQRYFMLAMETFRREPGHANSSEHELVLVLRDRARQPSGVLWHAEDVSEEMFALCEAWLAERGRS